MKRFLERWLPAPRNDPAPADAELALFDPQAPEKTVLVTTLGVDPRHIDEIIETTLARIGGRHVRIVYVTDNPDFTPFRRRKAAFEYLPPLIEQRLHADDLPWQPYLREKWGLLLAKWRPAQVLAYGMTIDSFLASAPAPQRNGRP